MGEKFRFRFSVAEHCDYLRVLNLALKIILFFFFFLLVRVEAGPCSCSRLGIAGTKQSRAHTGVSFHISFIARHHIHFSSWTSSSCHSVGIWERSLSSGVLCSWWHWMQVARIQDVSVLMRGKKRGSGHGVVGGWGLVGGVLLFSGSMKAILINHS